MSSSVVSSGLGCFRDFLEANRVGKGWLMDREWLGCIGGFPGDLPGGLMEFGMVTSSSELDSVCTCWLTTEVAKRSWPPSSKRGGAGAGPGAGRWCKWAGGAGVDVDGSDPLRCCRLEPKAIVVGFHAVYQRPICRVHT